MTRLLFEKTGNAVWISHLDLMRLFQRAFQRAGLHLRHSQGFNPRPIVSIALPLSVGVESVCEILDFDLDGQEVPVDVLRDWLNRSLVKGVRVVDAYNAERKVKELALLDCEVILEYDRGIPDGTEAAVSALFAREQLELPKRSKNGEIREQDILPMIRKLSAERKDENTVVLSGRICCQNPSLNPVQLAEAVKRYLPELTPDFAKCRRVEIYDTNGMIFR